MAFHDIVLSLDGEGGWSLHPGHRSLEAGRAADGTGAQPTVQPPPRPGGKARGADADAVLAGMTRRREREEELHDGNEGFSGAWAAGRARRWRGAARRGWMASRRPAALLTPTLLPPASQSWLWLARRRRRLAVPLSLGRRGWALSPQTCLSWSAGRCGWVAAPLGEVAGAGRCGGSGARSSWLAGRLGCAGTSTCGTGPHTPCRAERAARHPGRQAVAGAGVDGGWRGRAAHAAAGAAARAQGRGRSEPWQLAWQGCWLLAAGTARTPPAAGAAAAAARLRHWVGPCPCCHPWRRTALPA